MGARVHHIVPHTWLLHAKLPSNCPECLAWGNLNRFETDFRVQKIFFRRDPPNFEGSLRNFGGRVRKATGRGTKEFSFFWQSLTLLAGVVDKRNRTQRNGSALYVTIRMQPTHATQRNRCVRNDQNATNVTKRTQPVCTLRSICNECNARNTTQPIRTLRSVHMDSSGNPSGKIHPFGYFWVFLMMPPTKSASR